MIQTKKIPLKQFETIQTMSSAAKESTVTAKTQMSALATSEAKNAKSLPPAAVQNPSAKVETKKDDKSKASNRSELGSIFHRLSARLLFKRHT